MQKHMNITTAFAVFVLMFGMARISSAQNTGSISGQVVDAETGEPLPGANVVIQETNRGTAVGSDGEYVVINIPPGTYEVRASMIGYASVVQTDVLVNADFSTDVDFALSPSVIEGEEVTVVAERPVVDRDITGTASIMTAQDIENLPLVNFDDLLSQQAGVFSSGEATYVRGGLGSELNYVVDGISQQSGLLGDNWQRLNNTAVQEVSVLTGGYSAEYGSAMSGIVNVTQKEASRGQNNLNGTVRYQMRPPGQYHWGANIYSRDLAKYTDYDVSYWEQQLESPANRESYRDYVATHYPDRYDGDDPTAQELHELYLQQIEPDPVLENYDERIEHEGEATIWGSFSGNSTFLLSGRLRNGVHLYPSARDFHPEHNLTGRFNYFLSDDMKLTLSASRGGFLTAAQNESQLNTLTAGEDVGERSNMPEIRHPYTSYAYAPWGPQTGRMKGPQQKTVSTLGLQWRHILNESTFYTAQVSYLSDEIENIHDYSVWNEYPTVGPGERLEDLTGEFSLVYRTQAYQHYLLSQTYTTKVDLTSQINANHQLKVGTSFKLHDLENHNARYIWSDPADSPAMQNVFYNEPIEGAFYVQDKVDYEGIVLNVGVRVDGFHARRGYAEEPLYDPLAMQEHHGGDGEISNTAEIWWANRPVRDFYNIPIEDFRPLFEGRRQDKNTQPAEWKVAVAPRLGVSFPVTEYSKLRFSYGHFYQRPPWNMILGAPREWSTGNPFVSNGEESLGWQANPGLTYEKAVQYEVGFDQSIFEVLRLNVTAYYKDQTRLTQTSQKTAFSFGGGISSSDPSGTFAGSNASLSMDNSFFVRWHANDAFKDSRGLEVSLAKLFDGRWSAQGSFDYSIVTGGKYGVDMFYENPSLTHDISTGERQLDWLSDYRFKGNVTYVTPSGLGPMDVLGDIGISAYYEHYAGPLYTYYPPDFTGIPEPNNRRWYPHRRADLKFSKGFAVGGFEPTLGLTVLNLFNFRDRRLLGGQDLVEWEEFGRIPIIADTEEPNVWNFYNSVSNPRRMLYFTATMEF